MRTLLFFLLISLNYFCQTIKTNNLKINHGDMTLILTKDTCTFISVHKLKYVDFLKLDKERSDNWFQDVFVDKYDTKYYYKSGYDMGHLTPSHITSYDNELNYRSFSLFNSAPQLPKFNRGSWMRLEKSVEDSVSKYKKDVVIITGVIYDSVNYMGGSKIPIPSKFFKVLFIGKKKYVWVGSNLDGKIIISDLKSVNGLIRGSGEKVVMK